MHPPKFTDFLRLSLHVQTPHTRYNYEIPKQPLVEPQNSISKTILRAQNLLLVSENHKISGTCTWCTLHTCNSLSIVFNVFCCAYFVTQQGRLLTAGLVFGSPTRKHHHYIQMYLFYIRYLPNIIFLCIKNQFTISHNIFFFWPCYICTASVIGNTHALIHEIINNSKYGCSFVYSGNS